MSYSLSISAHSATASSDDIIAAADAAFASMPGAISGNVSGTDGSGASFGSSLPSQPVQDASTADVTASTDASATPSDPTASVDPTVIDTPADAAAAVESDPTASDAATADATAASTSDPTAGDGSSPTIVDFFTEAEAQAVADAFGGEVEHRGTAWHVTLPNAS